MEDVCNFQGKTYTFRTWKLFGVSKNNQTFKVKLGKKDSGEWRCDLKKQFLILSIDTVDVLILTGVGPTCIPNIGALGIASQVRLTKDGLKPPISWERTK